ncbi:MAG: ARMT1-like domain-containing protein [Candidatus Hadarchaeales archaeon]
MRIDLECFPCLLRQAVEACRLATEEEEKRMEVIRGALRILERAPRESTPPLLCLRVHGEVKRITGNADPYREVKRAFNSLARKMYPELRKMVEESSDKLLTAVKVAIAGNVIDVGPGMDFDPRRTVSEVMAKQLHPNHLEHLRRELERSKTVVYLADNAGEVLFDRVLIETLEDKHVIYVVKKDPLLNDASLEDARFAGMEELGEVVEIELDPETVYTPSQAELLRKAEVVISKGQGNYETLEGTGANLFYLLMVKCPVVARKLGGKVGDLVVKGERVG